MAFDVNIDYKAKQNEIKKQMDAETDPAKRRRCRLNLMPQDSRALKSLRLICRNMVNMLQLQNWMPCPKYRRTSAEIWLMMRAQITPHCKTGLKTNIVTGKQIGRASCREEC